jgi:alcohol dehydrogenase class IV
MPSIDAFNTLSDMTPFSFQTAGKILFGRGQADQAHDLVARFGTHVLVVRGRSVPFVHQFCARLRNAGCAVSEVVATQEPTLADVQSAVDLGRAKAVNVIVSIGGGSVIDLGKAAAALIPSSSPALEHLEIVGNARPLSAPPLPFIALPTTSGTGAEVTKNAVIGVPDQGRKVSLRDDRMFPILAIIDPALTDNTPRSVTLASGLDAITQVIEPYLSRRANPMTDAICRQAIPLGLAALARLIDGEDRAARDQLAYTSLIGGVALSNAGLGAVHGLAGVIGGQSAAPHGVICGRLLGPILRLNFDSAVAGGTDLTRYHEIKTHLATCFGLDRETAFKDLPEKLDQLGLPRLGTWLADTSDLAAMANQANSSSSMKSNPVFIEPEGLVQAIRGAL